MKPLIAVAVLVALVGCASCESDRTTDTINCGERGVLALTCSGTGGCWDVDIDRALRLCAPKEQRP